MHIDYNKWTQLINAILGYCGKIVLSSVDFHTFEIVRNSDKSISILTTDIDPAVKDGSPAAISRDYAVAALQIFKYKVDSLPSGSYNAELVKQLSPEMQTKIQNYGTPIQ